MKTRTYQLEAEAQRIDTELDDLADEAAALADDESLTDEQRTRIQRLERQYAGLQWALNPDEDEARDPYEAVTLSELTAGAYIKAGAQAEADAEQSGSVVGGDTERLYRVAQAVDDADFLPDGATFDQKLIAVGGLKPQFFFWLERQVDDLTSPDVEGNSFAQRVEEKQRAEPSTSTGG